MTTYIHGTSTRNVDDLVRALGCDSGVSKSTVSRICGEIDEQVAEFRQPSTNPLERVNKGIKHRSNVVGIVPNDAAAIRLVDAVLLETHDEWHVAQRTYFSEHSMAERATISDSPSARVFARPATQRLNSASGPITVVVRRGALHSLASVGAAFGGRALAGCQGARLPTSR